jgi:hypothetical protein
MQDELNALYEANWRTKVLTTTSPDCLQLRGPDLVWVAPAYVATSPRVLLVGKEPLACDFSFAEFVRNWSVDRAIACYQQFNFGEHYNASPWWTFYNQLRRELFGAGCERGVVGWTNLVKFVTPDRKSILGKPFEQEALDIQGDLFLRELAILQPDVCVFATGPDYDRIIERHYPGVKFEECCVFGSRTLAALSHALLPLRSYRTYHPKALRFQKIWDAVFAQLCAHLA